MLLGRCRLVAVLVRISLTTSGDGKEPWVARNRWSTRAATPEINGADSLVPPVSHTPTLLPLKSWQPAPGSHAAQLRSPGAMRSTPLVPVWLGPAELRAETPLSL